VGTRDKDLSPGAKGRRGHHSEIRIGGLLLPEHLERCVCQCLECCCLHCDSRASAPFLQPTRGQPTGAPTPKTSPSFVSPAALVRFVSWVSASKPSLEQNGAMLVVVVSHSLIRVDLHRNFCLRPCGLAGCRRRPPPSARLRTAHLSKLCQSTGRRLCLLSLVPIYQDRPSVSRVERRLDLALRRQPLPERGAWQGAIFCPKRFDRLLTLTLRRPATGPDIQAPTLAILLYT
jgi:hypothetical protein